MHLNGRRVPFASKTARGRGRPRTGRGRRAAAPALTPVAPHALRAGRVRIATSLKGPHRRVDEHDSMPSRRAAHHRRRAMGVPSSWARCAEARSRGPWIRPAKCLATRPVISVDASHGSQTGGRRATEVRQIASHRSRPGLSSHDRGAVDERVSLSAHTRRVCRAAREWPSSSARTPSSARRGRLHARGGRSPGGSPRPPESTSSNVDRFIDPRPHLRRRPRAPPNRRP